MPHTETSGVFSDVSCVDRIWELEIAGYSLLWFFLLSNSPFLWLTCFCFKLSQGLIHCGLFLFLITFFVKTVKAVIPPMANLFPSNIKTPQPFSPSHWEATGAATVGENWSVLSGLQTWRKTLRRKTTSTLNLFSQPWCLQATESQAVGAGMSLEEHLANPQALSWQGGTLRFVWGVRTLGPPHWAAGWPQKS